MKKFVGTLFCLLICVGAFCQQDIPSLVEGMKTGNLSFNFKFRASGRTFPAMSGSLSIQGKSFSANFAGQRIISDGNTLWTILDPQEEIYIENAAPLPAFIYDSRQLMKMLSNLSYSDGGISGTFTAAGGGQSFDFEISGIRVGPPLPSSGFKVNTREFGDSWVITDLR
ncbi:MAG: hypothetical protein MJY61_01240 [Bacteroidales bacterium]|nr:hypothetical protein [Bacteroidales bacterium]